MDMRSSLEEKISEEKKAQFCGSSNMYLIQITTLFKV